MLPNDPFCKFDEQDISKASYTLCIPVIYNIVSVVVPGEVSRGVDLTTVAVSECLY